jgi:hypothetical protein
VGVSEGFVDSHFFTIVGVWDELHSVLFSDPWLTVAVCLMVPALVFVSLMSVSEWAGLSRPFHYLLASLSRGSTSLTMLGIVLIICPILAAIIGLIALVRGDSTALCLVTFVGGLFLAFTNLLPPR